MSFEQFKNPSIEQGPQSPDNEPIEVGVPEKALKPTLEQKEKDAESLELRREGEEIYSREFTDRLKEVLGHEFKDKDGKKIVLQDVINKHIKDFSSKEFSQKSSEEKSEDQRKFIKDLARQISRIPHDSWEINFRQAMENNALNCSNCAALMGLILEQVKEKTGLKDVEYGSPYGHAMNLVALADGRIFYVDSRNNIVEDLELGKNTNIGDKDGLKVYKIEHLKDKIDYKIIPAASVKDGAIGAYLSNLQGIPEHEVPSVIKMKPEKEQKRFIEGAKRVYEEEGLFDENKHQRIQEISSVFNQKLNKYEESEEFKKEIERWESAESDRDTEQAKRGIGTFFDSHKDGRKRIEAILKRVEPFLQSGLIDGDKVRQSLLECSKIRGREEFIEKALSALEPISSLRENNPKAFEAIERSIFLKQIESRGFKIINEILSYGRDKDFVHIHLAPARELGIGELRKLVREGLEELAKIVKGNKKIKRIEAISWIVDKHPGIIEKLGFTVEGEIDQETRKKYHIDKEEELGRATMTREEFLKKYLKEK